MSHGSTQGLSPLAPRSPFYHGPFGRLFPDLAPWAPADPDEDFLDFANDHMLEVPGATPGEVDVGETAHFDSDIPAGYTYFGQFVDHDITFDTTSSLQRAADPSRLLNARTPRFDLDNLYGRGSADQPYLFQKEGAEQPDGSPGDRRKMLIGRTLDGEFDDLPRNADGVALIGDMRNDENSMVSQLQLAFLLAHNELVDRADALHPDGRDPGAFESACRTLRWLYQWIVWNDFVHRIVDPDVWECALHKVDECATTYWRPGLKHVYRWKNQPYMPVEFSGAAYRFGHSMVRNRYRTNFGNGGVSKFVPIFDNSAGGVGEDLRGFRPIPSENRIEWDWFLDMTTSGGEFPQRARKIDAKLANALAFLHEGSVGSPDNVLAARNLKRGAATYELPSGPDVARALGVEPIESSEGDIDALWYYILKEAEIGGGNRLGTVGSIIVAAVFSGLLLGDPHSWVNVDPCWRPTQEPLLREGEDDVDGPDGEWTLASIIRIAGVPTSAGEFPQPV